MKSIQRFEVDDKSIKIKELLNEEFLEVEFKAISSAKPNRNMSHFTPESLKNAIPTCYNKPILGSFSKDLNDFRSHESELEYDEDNENFYFDNCYDIGETPIGMIRSTDRIRVEQGLDGLYWMYFSGAIWTQYAYQQVKSLLQKANKKVSVEVAVNDFEIDENGIEIIKDFTLNGITILGDKYETGIADAEMTIPELMNRPVFQKRTQALKFALENLQSSLNNISSEESSSSEELEIFRRKEGMPMADVKNFEEEVIVNNEEFEAETCEAKCEEAKCEAETCEAKCEEAKCEAETCEAKCEEAKCEEAKCEAETCEAKCEAETCAKCEEAKCEEAKCEAETCEAKCEAEDPEEPEDDPEDSEPKEEFEAKCEAEEIKCEVALEQNNFAGGCEKCEDCAKCAEAETCAKCEAKCEEAKCEAETCEAKCEEAKCEEAKCEAETCEAKCEAETFNLEDYVLKAEFEALQEKYDALVIKVQEHQAKELATFGANFINSEAIDEEAKANFVAEVTEKCNSFELTSEEGVQEFAEAKIAMYLYKQSKMQKQTTKEFEVEIREQEAFEAPVKDNSLLDAINKLARL